MELIEVVTIKSECTVGLICDKCHNPIEMIDSTYTQFDCHNGGTVYWSPGYGSKYDGTSLRLDLCETCILELVTKCLYDDYNIIDNRNHEPFTLIIDESMNEPTN